MKQGLVLGIIGIFFLSLVHARVLIEQVYVNPVGSESGGEAVVIRNMNKEIVFLENWTLATQTSKKDVTLRGLQLVPNQTALVADAGWSMKKDDPFWKAADAEEALTLDNTNGGVALIDAHGTIVDAVGWGDPSKMEYVWYSGIPAHTPSKGKTLLRVQDTGNNAEDFILGEPQFEQEDTTVLVLQVSEEVSIVHVVLSPDEVEEKDVQVFIPQKGTKKIKVTVEVIGRPKSVRAVLEKQSIDLVGKNSSLFEGEFMIDTTFQSGVHTIIVYADAIEENIQFTARAQQKVHVDQSRVLLSSYPGKQVQTSVLVKNEGYAGVRIHPIIMGNSSLDSFIEVSLDGENFQHPSDVEVTVTPGETRMIFVRIATPSSFVPGVYKSRMRIEEVQ